MEEGGRREGRGGGEEGRGKEKGKEYTADFLSVLISVSRSLEIYGLCLQSVSMYTYGEHKPLISTGCAIDIQTIAFEHSVSRSWKQNVRAFVRAIGLH